MLADDDIDLPPTPPSVAEAAKTAIEQLVLLGTSCSIDLSGAIYEAPYKRFMEYCKDENIKKYSENALLGYFIKLKNVNKMKSSSMWSHYSMIRSMLSIRHKVDISKYLDLRAFLKKEQRENYQPKKSAVLTKNQFLDFLAKAPDERYLGTKVVLLFGVAGACRCDELIKMRVQDIEDHGSLIYVKVPDGKTSKKRSFTIVGDDFVNIYKKYASMRPVNFSETRFFVKYMNGKCTRNVMGIHKIGNVARDVALYFKIPNWQEYTGHCLRRTSATVLADCGGDITLLKRHGGWKSDSVAAGYIEESMQNKKDIAAKILFHVPSTQTYTTSIATPGNSVVDSLVDHLVKDQPETSGNGSFSSIEKSVIQNIVESFEIKSEESSRANVGQYFHNATLHNCTLNFNFNK